MPVLAEGGVNLDIILQLLILAWGLLIGYTLGTAVGEVQATKKGKVISTDDFCEQVAEEISRRMKEE